MKTRQDDEKRYALSHLRKFMLPKRHFQLRRNLLQYLSYLSVECNRTRLTFGTNSFGPWRMIFTTWFNATTHIFQENKFSSEIGNRIL